MLVYTCIKTSSSLLVLRIPRVENNVITAFLFNAVTLPVQAPVCEAPVCEAPVCEAPVCEAPVCEAPVCEARAGLTLCGASCQTLITVQSYWIVDHQKSGSINIQFLWLSVDI